MSLTPLNLSILSKMKIIGICIYEPIYMKSSEWRLAYRQRLINDERQ